MGVPLTQREKRDLDSLFQKLLIFHGFRADAIGFSVSDQIDQSLTTLLTAGTITVDTIIANNITSGTYNGTGGPILSGTVVVDDLEALFSVETVDLLVTGNSVLLGPLGVTGSITGTTALLTGTLQAGNLLSSGTVDSVNGNFTGTVNISTAIVTDLDVTGTLTLGAGGLAGPTSDITCQNLFATASINAATSVVSGTSSAGTFNASVLVSAPTANITDVNATTVDTTTVTATGAIQGASVTATGTISGALLFSSGAISGTSLSVTGSVSAGSISLSGAFSASSISATNISTTTINSTGLATLFSLSAGATSVTSLASLGTITGTDITASGTVQGGTVTSTGAINADSGTISNLLTVGSLSVIGAFSVNSLTVTTSINTATLTATGLIQGATLTSTGALNGASAVISGSLSAGATSITSLAMTGSITGAVNGSFSGTVSAANVSTTGTITAGGTGITLTGGATITFPDASVQVSASPWTKFTDDIYFSLAGTVGIGISTPSALTRLHISNDSAVIQPLLIDSYFNGGTFGSGTIYKTARGSFAIPTAVQTNDQIMALSARGYGATAFSSDRAAVTVRATEPWTDLVQGTSIAFSTTANGGTVTSDKLVIDGSGNASLVGNLAVDTNVLFVDTVTNRVGINDGAPSEALDVVGNAVISGTLGVTGAITGGSVVSNTSVVATTLVQGATVTATGALNGATASITGALTADSVAATTSVSGATVTATGLLSGGSLSVTGTSTQGVINAGAITGTSVSSTGTLSATGTSTLGVVNAGAVTGTSLSSTGTLSVSGISTVGVVNATDLSASGTLSVTGISTQGVINAGAVTGTSLSSTGALSATGTSTLGVVNAGAVTGTSLSSTGTLSATGTSTLGVVNAGAISGTTGTFSGDLFVDVNVLAVDTTNNRVGINKTVPVEALDVVGNAAVSGNLSVAGTSNLGVISAGAISGTTGTFTGDLVVDTDVLFVDTTNNRVGINKAAPLQALDVLGNGAFSGTLSVVGTSTLGTVSAGAVTGTSLSSTGTLSATGISTLGTVNAGAVSSSSLSSTGTLSVTGISTLGTVNAGAISGTTGSFTGNLAVETNVLLVDTATNRVGINKSVPAVELDVVGSAAITGGLSVTGTSTLGVISGGAISGTSLSSSGTLSVTGTSTLGVVNAGAISGTTGTFTGDLFVDTNVLAVDTLNNRVGINKTVPVEALDVVGNAAVSGTLSVVGTSTLSTVNAGAVTGTSLSSTGALSATGISTLGVVNAGAISGTTGTFTGNFAVDTDVLFVDTTNNRIGVNKAIPVQALDVVGNAAISGTLSVVGTSTLATVNAGSVTGTSLSSTGALSATGISTLGTVNAGAVNGTSLSSTGTLNVTGISTLGTVNAGALNGTSVSSSGTLSATGISTLGTVNATSLSSSGTLSATGTSTLGVVNAGAVTGTSLSSTGTLSATGTSTLGVVNAGAVTGTSLSSTSTLSVTGTSTLATVNAGAISGTTGTFTGDFFVDTNVLAVDTTNNRVGINKTVPVEALDVVGNAAVSGTLSVAGTSTLGAVNAAAISGTSGTFTGNVSVDTNVLLVDAVNNRIGVNKTVPVEALDVVGNTAISGTLSVVGTSTLAAVNAGAISGSTGTFSGNVAVDTNVLLVDTVNNRIGVNKTVPVEALDVVGNAAVSGNFSVGGTLNISSIVATTGTFSGNLVVDTNVLFVDTVGNFVGINKTVPVQALDVVGNAAISGTLSVSGTSTLSTVNGGAITGSTLSSTGTLGVTGTSTLGVVNAGAISGTTGTFSGNLAVDTDVLFVDTASNRVGINKAVPVQPLDVVGNAAVSANLTSATANIGETGTYVDAGLHVVTDSATVMPLHLDNYLNGATAGSAIALRTARGTKSVPTAVQSGDQIASISARAYGATGFSTTARGAFRVHTSENWTDTAQGTRAAISTTATGTTTMAEKLTVANNGDVNVFGKMGIGDMTPYADSLTHTVLESTTVQSSHHDLYYGAGTEGAGITFRSARGTKASPTAVQNGDLIGFVASRGYGATAFPSVTRTSLRFRAAENWTDTAQGSTIALVTTTPGTTTTVDRLTLDGNGNVFINSVGGRIFLGATTAAVSINSGAIDPNGVVTAAQGSMFLRTNGTASTTLYVNTNGGTVWNPLN